MLEYTKVKSPRDIQVRGYKDLGIHIEGGEYMQRLVNTAEEDKIDLVVLDLGGGGVYQLFVRSIHERI